jgi:hypothetical protein
MLNITTIGHFKHFMHIFLVITVVTTRLRFTNIEYLSGINGYQTPIDYTELVDIAGRADYVFNVTQIDHIADIKNDLTNKLHCTTTPCQFISRTVKDPNILLSDNMLTGVSGVCQLCRV